jgi:hypothetical protein
VAVEIVIAAAAFVNFSAKPRKTKIALSVLLVWLCVSTMSYYPNLIAYMNEWVIDRTQSYKILVDSNLDYGQEGDLVSDFLKHNPGRRAQPQQTCRGKGSGHGESAGRGVARLRAYVVVAAIPTRKPCRIRTFAVRCASSGRRCPPIGQAAIFSRYEGHPHLGPPLCFPGADGATPGAVCKDERFRSILSLTPLSSTIFMTAGMMLSSRFTGRAGQFGCGIEWPSSRVGITETSPQEDWCVKT